MTQAPRGTSPVHAPCWPASIAAIATPHPASPATSCTGREHAHDHVKQPEHLEGAHVVEAASLVPEGVPNNGEEDEALQVQLQAQLIRPERPREGRRRREDGKMHARHISRGQDHLGRGAVVEPTHLLLKGRAFRSPAVVNEESIPRHCHAPQGNEREPGDDAHSQGIHAHHGFIEGPKAAGKARHAPGRGAGGGRAVPGPFAPRRGAAALVEHALP
mmetsp:Transcript_28564/g.76920  ORF Transcript_28564/g.76920 Transcript_28564/m.76920 type:complete len:217 (+) Transcript_28564:879-1529(+)